jgi:cob(I)alamin adenosyltransferase
MSDKAITDNSCTRNYTIEIGSNINPPYRDKRVKIYTRTGDLGQTSLYNGDRLYKDSTYFEALGSIDECNSWLGMVDKMCDWESLGNVSPSQTELKDMLQDIQQRLLDIGSHVATPLDHSSSAKIKRTEFDESKITDLEHIIDRMDAQLPKLVNFILPGGNGAIFHMIRVQVRTAERRVVSLVNAGACSNVVLMYLNRLSDFFFQLARYTSHEDEVYKKA